MNLDSEGFFSPEMEGIIRENLDRHAGLFSLSKEINKLLHAIKGSAAIDQDDMFQALSACLYSRIVDSYQAIVIMYEHRFVIIPEIVARSMLESLFMLKLCIMREDEFLFKIINGCKKESLRHLQNICDDKFVKEHNIDIEGVKRQIDTLPNKPKIYEYAKKAQMLGWYRSVFPQWSDSVHSSITSLERCLSKDAENLICFECGPRDDGSILLHMTTIFELVCNAMHFADGIFGLKEHDKIEELLNKVQAMARKTDS